MAIATFRNYTDKDKVNELTRILADYSIEYVVSEDRDSLDGLYGSDHTQINYYVKIESEKFDYVNDILMDLVVDNVATVDSDHYLFTFSDQELFEILTKPDEWNQVDFVLAKRLLSQRGRDVSDSTIAFLKQKRINDLAMPEPSNKAWIYSGYLMSIFGGLFGIFIGWHLIAHKKTLPNGRRVFGHTQQDRTHGKWMVVIGITMFLVFLLTRFGNQYYY